MFLFWLENSNHNSATLANGTVGCRYTVVQQNMIVQAANEEQYKSVFRLTIHTLYLDLTSELWAVYCEGLGDAVSSHFLWHPEYSRIEIGHMDSP